MNRILVVDDEKEIRELFREVLENRGYEVLICESGDEAIKTIESTAIFAAFVDIRMPGTDGIETLRQMKAVRPETHVVMITGYTRDEAVNEALRLGCFVCMMKPFKLRDILGVLDVLEADMDQAAQAA
ncbi:MAG: response regulator [Armatimonadetes bacterium]|nr:response regulator [Armatimonadota bacterium]